MARIVHEATVGTMRETRSSGELQARRERYLCEYEVWGTTISIDVRDCHVLGTNPAIAASSVREALRFFDEVDEVFSTFKPGSAVSALRRGDDPRTGLSPEHRAWFDEVEQRSIEMRELTAGAFDPWCVTGGYDPSGIVKGWAADRAAQMLDATLRHFELNAGGDVVCRGGTAPGEPWRVGLQHPRDRGAVYGRVLLTDGAVAGSGLYERGEHIHCRTGPLRAKAAHVHGPDAAACDALATALVVAGKAGRSWFTGLNEYGASIVEDDMVYEWGAERG